MIRQGGEGLLVSGPLNLATARAMLEAGNRLNTGPDTVFDLAEVEEVDSSGLSVIFGWVRAARNRGATARIRNVPQNLLSLAALYGVSELLPLA